MAAGRGTRVGVVLVVVLLVLLGVLFAADRIAVGVAEDRIADEAQKNLTANNVTTEGAPKVDIAGFPFLTQVVGGTYQKITINMNRPVVDKLKLNDLRVEARAVHADAQSLMNGTGEVVADQITGIATISWENVRPLLELAGLPAFDPSQLDLKVTNNKIEIRVPLQYGSFNVTLVAKGSMIVEAGKVRFKLEDVTTEQGQVPNAVRDLIRQNQQRLSVTLNLPGLPYNLVVDKVESSDTGMLVIASAKDVKLSG